jgi:hypothetical protein
MICFTYALLMLEEAEDGRHTRVDRRFTRALLALYSRFTHAEESEDGRCFTDALLMLYSCCTHLKRRRQAVFALYCSVYLLCSYKSTNNTSGVDRLYQQHFEKQLHIAALKQEQALYYSVYLLY